jgi:hypothetical protein
MWSLITLWILLCNYLYGHEILPYNLPVLPKTTPHQNKTSEKLIPRYLWIAVTEIEKESDMNYHLPALFKRNSNWDIRMVDNHNKDIFMNEVFFSNIKFTRLFHKYIYYRLFSILHYFGRTIR